MTRFFESHKNHLIISAIIPILFTVVVVVFSNPTPVFRFMIPAFIVILGLAGLYNWRYLKQKDNMNLWVWLRFIFLAWAWFGVLFLIPSGFGRAVYIIFTLPILFFFEFLVGSKGQQILQNEFLISTAGLILVMFGFSSYFQLPGVIYMSIVFVITLLIVRTSFELVPHPTLVKWVSAISIGLFVSELFWVLNFLPLHYSALAMVCYVVVYILWVMFYQFLYHSLTNRQIQYHLILSLILISLILITTPWGIQT